MRGWPRLLLAVAAAAGACRLETGSVGAGFAAGSLATTEYVRGDPVLARSVAIRDVESRNREGILSVAFEIASRSGEDLLFEYRFEWTDAEGLRLDDPGAAWTPIVLRAEPGVPVRGTAPQAGAVGWRLEVRPSGGRR